jgi:kinesin family protein 18/19
MRELYSRINDARDESEVAIRLSYLEIYNETIRDLLSAEPTPAAGGGLMLREDSSNKISVVGITEYVPSSPEAVLEAITEGNKRRTMSPTEANAVSSRSHAVLQINVTQRPRASGTSAETTSASLSIIDLAGSERASATANSGARMKEGANINKSLLALGNCINALCSTAGSRRAHVPYRNSKLTRLLKFSLGGNCKTVMIVCVSPSSAHYDETHNTLKYANQAKNIRTKVSRNMLNVDRHVAQYVQAIHELKEEVQELKTKLAERGAIESAGEKRKREEIGREVVEAKRRMLESTENVKRLVAERAASAVQLEAAAVRLEPLRAAAAALDDEIAKAGPDEAADAVAERQLIAALIARSEARAQEEAAVAQARSLANSLQMQSALVLAASNNHRFDAEASARVRESGDALLREVEAARATKMYEALKADLVASASDVVLATGAAARATAALKEAAGELEFRATTGSTDADESTPEALGRLAKLLRSAGASNDAIIQRLTGIVTPDVPAPRSAAAPRRGTAVLRRSARQSVHSMPPLASSSAAASPPRAMLRANRRISHAPRAVAPPSPSKVRPGAVSSAAAPTAASLARSHLVASPRKARARTSLSGRRMSTLATMRPPPRASIAPAAVDKGKKAFRWADEAGEGCIDDAHATGAGDTGAEADVESEASPDEAGRARKAAVDARMASSSDGADEGASSGTEWEDERSAAKRQATTARPAPKPRSVSAGSGSGGGGLFDRNFLAKRAAANSALGALSEAQDDFDLKLVAAVAPRARTLSTTTAAPPVRVPAARAPFTELAQTSESGPLAASSSASTRSSPYKRRDSRETAGGPVRRQRRSSLPRLADSGKPPSPSLASHAQFASGPPGHTAARLATGQQAALRSSTSSAANTSRDALDGSSSASAGVPARVRGGSGMGSSSSKGLFGNSLRSASGSAAPGASRAHAAPPIAWKAGGR